MKSASCAALGKHAEKYRRKVSGLRETKVAGLQHGIPPTPTLLRMVAENMNVPSDSQKITLRRWRVIEIEALNGSRSRQVWGHDVTNNRGRASSAIIAFNLDTMIATTRSSKNYGLVGLPGNSRLGKSAWNNWRSNNMVVAKFDVTKEYLNIDQISTVGFAKFNSSVSQ